MLADFDQLALGVFVAPPPGDLTHRNGGPTGAIGLGVRFAVPETFKAWQQVQVAELWQWLALSTFLDPSSIPLEATLAKQVRARSAARLFQDRTMLLGKLVEAGAIPCVYRASAEGWRSLVHLADFLGWAGRVQLPLPPEFPAAKTKPKRAKQAAESAYLRQNDLIPALLPFSAATLWRKVRSGDFPAPTKLSSAVTAWKRDDVEAWLVTRSQGKSNPRDKSAPAKAA